MPRPFIKERKQLMLGKLDIYIQKYEVSPYFTLHIKIKMNQSPKYET